MKFSNVFNGKLLIYFVFWAVSFYVGLEVFSRADEIRTIDVIYTFLFHLPLLFLVSVHSFHLLPNYLGKSNFWAYGLTLFCLLGTAYPIYNFSYLILADWIFPGYYLVGTYEPLEVIGFSVLYLLLSSSFEFARNWFDGLQAKNRVSELENEKIAAELKALRAQVNPHFLFNSLNTIYNESLKRSHKAPDLILKLSDMLRYVVDKMDQNLVPVEEEIEYLKNFIELHKERLNEPSKVNFLIDGDFDSLKIAPLLLLNFVENAFKHADLTDDSSFISIDLSAKGNQLTLKCSNSFFQSGTKNNSHGSGIENTKRRLELAYPDHYSLTMHTDDNTYHLELKLELD